MAENSSTEQVDYFPLDDDFELLFDLLDEDEELEEEIESVCTYIDGDAQFNCDLCEKQCKSCGGLKLHKLKKHGIASNGSGSKFKSPTLSQTMIVSALKDACSKELHAAMYPECVLKELKKYLDELSITERCIHENCLKMLKQELEMHIDFRSTERFYTTFYNKVVGRSEFYAPSLDKTTSMLIFRKFGDILMVDINKVELEGINTKNLSQKELAALQYLGGYVVRNMYNKYRNSKKYKNDDHQQAMALLKAGKTERTNSNAELVNALSRGGLWQIKNPVERILVIAEKRFSIETAKKNITKIEVAAVVKKLMEFSYIQDYFKLVIEEADMKISKEVAKNVLFGILTLYVRIRAFSFAKDVVQRHKIKLKNKGKQTALRKILKRMDCPEGDK